MDRRVFLVSGLAGLAPLAACAPRVITVICDPALAPALDRALRTRGGRTYRLEPLAPRELLARAEGGAGLLVVTREPKLADRLQRLGFARIQNRWKPDIGGAPAQMVVTTGDGEAAAVHMARWLAGDEAAALLNTAR